MTPSYPKNMPIAIRSLQSEHHAMHLPPEVVIVTWMLGKRCNYDCSYCPPHLHDLASPHLDLDVVKNFLAKIDKWAEENQKRLRFSLTGGEPYVHPDILTILENIFCLRTASDQLTVITNGSLPLSLYQKSLEYVTNLTISIHLERSQDEVEKVVAKIIELNRNHGKFLNVNLICVATELEMVKRVKATLEDNNVKHVLRRIRPNFDENDQLYRPHQHKRDNSLAQLPIAQQAKAKNDYKLLRVERIQDLYSMYYNQEELDWFKENIAEVWWENMGLWYENDVYLNGNSDDLLNRDLTGFQGWTCWAGVDSVYIEFDGTIYRGVCANDGALCRIDDAQIVFPTQPTVCTRKSCLSNPDIVTRKCSSDKYRHLVDPTV